MGGSILGTKCIYSFFKSKIKKKFYFLDNLDENIYLDLKKIKNLKNSCFIVVSKSGNTLETFINLNMIYSKSMFKDKIIFITEKKNNLIFNLAKKLNAQIIEHKNYIGGRYSVLSEVGMFPAALMGLKISRFRDLNKFLSNKKFTNSLIHNATSIYTLNSLGIKTSIILNYESSFNDLGYWYQQLVAESLGKNKKGITPFLSQAPKDHHSILQLYLDGPKDKFFTFISTSIQNNKKKIPESILPSNMKFLKKKTIKNIIEAQCKAVKNIFKLNSIPYRHLNLNIKNEEDVGKIFTFFILETMLLARLMNVNPFNQPAVEKIKIETEKNLLN
jgi:glucose-6-phosphate isomerase